MVIKIDEERILKIATIIEPVFAQLGYTWYLDKLPPTRIQIMQAIAEKVEILREMQLAGELTEWISSGGIRVLLDGDDDYVVDVEIFEDE